MVIMMTSAVDTSIQAVSPLLTVGAEAAAAGAAAASAAGAARRAAAGADAAVDCADATPAKPSSARPRAKEAMSFLMLESSV